MAIWTRQSGVTTYTPKRPHLWREETRKWYLRLDRAISADPLTLKVYHALADASAGNASFAASGSVAVTQTDHTVTLTNNGAVAPTFTGATVDVTLAATTSTGTAVWECDLGTRIARSLLRVLRGFSLISKANGYFFDLGTVELGIRQWEDAVAPEDLTPYVGIGAMTIRSEPREVGQFSLTSTLDLQGVAHVKNESEDVVSDANVLMLYHDLRRALRSVETTAYDGSVNDGGIFDTALIASSDPDLGIVWARERGTINFLVTCTIEENQSEITGG